jgi:hypothetical protein
VKISGFLVKRSARKRNNQISLWGSVLFSFSGSLLLPAGQSSFAFGRARPHPGQTTLHSSVGLTLHLLADRTQGEKSANEKQRGWL